MILNFLAPSTRHPVGGNAVVYEFATAMAQRGHEVHFYHHDLFGGDAVKSLDEIGWYEFRAELTHHFMGSPPVDPGAIAEADFFFGYSEQVEENPHFGLPVCWVQGYRMYSDDREAENFSKPCPKICIARWLVDVAIEHGVPAGELVHISNALHHDRYRVTRPIEDRPARVLFCYNAHRMKGAPLALDVLAELHERRPGVEIVGFGSVPPARPLPDWIRFHVSPPQHVLVDELYNTSAVFLWTSEVEGFGLPALEAMACGAALVTTDNGGSRDYATHESTALVASYPDRDTLLAHVQRLLDDDDDRGRIAAAGRSLAESFTWARAGYELETFLERYRADPVAYGRPG
jgi:glycosyltransferase involved in cell wall biosynthesis